MSDLGIGKIIEEGVPHRDAIHIAIAPVDAGEKLKPGQHVGLGTDGRARLKAEELLGIVDPYLKAPVQVGQRFWLFLYPNTIRSLRHHWEHPAFREKEIATLRDEVKIMMAQDWVGQVGEAVGMTGEEVIRAARRFIEGGVYITLGFDAPEITYDAEQLWDSYETITGEKVDKENRKRTFFSCAC